MDRPKLLALLLAAAAFAARAAAPAPLPARLSETGLYAAGSTTQLRAGVLAFAPQYPLWSDGATKRRWLWLPAGAAIDASRPDAWEFPAGTRLWKEFGHGQRIETRYIERLADGTWRFASYVWTEDGSDAVLAPAQGTVSVTAAGAPGGRYAVPSRSDCRACHEGSAVPVLGVSALQLSPDRDPLAPHAEPAKADHVDLRTLVALGRLRGLPAQLLATPPRIAAPTPTARAALGYLHGNCGHCHNDTGPLAGLELVLAQEAAPGSRSVPKAMASLLGQASHFRPSGATAGLQRIAAGRDEPSVLAVRMRSNNPMARMPPLGVQVSDREAIGLIEAWIHHDLATSTPSNPENMP